MKSPTNEKPDEFKGGPNEFKETTNADGCMIAYALRGL